MGNDLRGGRRWSREEEKGNESRRRREQNRKSTRPGTEPDGIPIRMESDPDMEEGAERATLFYMKEKDRPGEGREIGKKMIESIYRVRWDRHRSRNSENWRIKPMLGLIDHRADAFH